MPSPPPAAPRVSVVPDVEQLRALAHPVRVTMLGMLRLDGPATATELAARLGLNSGATSYHLRQLARHGFVEDDPTDDRRTRRWRASHDNTSTGTPGHVEPAQREAEGVFVQAALVTQTGFLQDAVAEQSRLPEEWAASHDHSDWALWLTPAQAEEMLRRIHDVVGEFVSGTAPLVTDDPPEGAEQYMVQVHGFPRPGRLVRRAEER